MKIFHDYSFVFLNTRFAVIDTVEYCALDVS